MNVLPLLPFLTIYTKRHLLALSKYSIKSLNIGYAPFACYCESTISTKFLTIMPQINEVDDSVVIFQESKLMSSVTLWGGLPDLVPVSCRWLPCQHITDSTWMCCQNKDLNFFGNSFVHVFPFWLLGAQGHIRPRWSPNHIVQLSSLMTDFKNLTSSAKEFIWVDNSRLLFELYLQVIILLRHWYLKTNLIVSSVFFFFFFLPS